MKPAIRAGFEALLQDQGLADPSWILRLDAFDEPPLFLRTNQVEFLRALRKDKRPLAALQFALSVIEAIAAEAARGASNRTFFICVTLSDFEWWHTGEQLVPTPAIYVNPHEIETAHSGLSITRAHSAEGIEVTEWLGQLGSDYQDRYCVGELKAGVFNPDLARVYVGWRTNPSGNVTSVGREISVSHD